MRRNEAVVDSLCVSVCVGVESGRDRCADWPIVVKTDIMNINMYDDTCRCKSLSDCSDCSLPSRAKLGETKGAGTNMKVVGHVSIRREAPQKIFYRAPHFLYSAPLSGGARHSAMFWVSSRPSTVHVDTKFVNCHTVMN